MWVRNLSARQAFKKWGILFGMCWFRVGGGGLIGGWLEARGWGRGYGCMWWENNGSTNSCSANTLCLKEKLREMMQSHWEDVA